MPAYRQTWDNRHFFNGSDDPAIQTTVDSLRTETANLAAACAPFGELLKGDDIPPQDRYDDIIDTIRTIHHHRMQLAEKLGNVFTFIYTTLSVDAQDADANNWMPVLQQISAEVEQAIKPLQIFLTRASDQFITAMVADPVLQELEFGVRCDRQLRDQLLSVAEEQLIAGLQVNGLRSWGNLYQKLAGTLQCTVNGETMGLARAANLLNHPQRETRKAAWEAIQSAWSSHQESVAMILNSINGWRLEETKQRAHTRELHYLDKSCHQNRIQRATLDTLMDTAYRHRAIGQRALNTMARVLQIPQMAPWDLMAPAPARESSTITFDAAIDLIAAAFRQLTPAMGDFAVMMAEKGWIDAEPTPNRATGAYCTKFLNPREPRIFATFDGSMSNVTTLAHELGHAWHNWVMQDMPLMQTSYPMTLAETASVFGETLVRNALFEQANTPAQKLEIFWQDAERAAAFLVNIPARFEFEKRLVEARKTGFVGPNQLKTMMAESWQHWYEDSLCQYDDMFWASKLHFSISQLGFYNYPYLFGYLFSLGIYAQREQMGDQFNALYTAILRDTGRMTAEEVIQHHLQKDIRQPQFWEDSLAIVEEAISQFEALTESIGEPLTVA